MIRMMKEFFLLETRRTTYCFRVTEQGFLQHLYYGRRLDLAGGLEALVPQVRHFPGNGAGLDGVCLEDMALEVSSPGLGDLRESMAIVRTAEGDTLTDFRFEGAEVLEEKPELEELDLSLLSEVKRNEKGTVEIKLVDRLAVLEQLAALAGKEEDGSLAFLKALGTVEESI